MNTILMNLEERSYPIYIGSDLLSEKDLLQKHVVGEQVMIVSQPPVASHYIEKIKAAFVNHHCDEVIIDDGEANKTLSTWQRILSELIKKHHHRDTTLIALGGGVTGDITGFAAACYQRGVNYIQIPTTLLAQVDASVGGKTAVNLPNGKNMVGAFYQPKAVFIDINTLNTLPEREFRAGIAEIIKAALLYDESFFCWLEENLSLLLAKDNAKLTEAIERAVQVKANIVAADEKEQTGLRALLNLGHTFAHAIETVTEYKMFLHGEAVAIGLCLAAKLSFQRGTLSEDEANRIINIITAVKLPTQIPSSTNREQLLAAIKLDKKISDGKLVFILLDGIGAAQKVTDITKQELEAIM